MARIHATLHQDQNLSIFTIEGRACKDEMLKVITGLKSNQVTRDIIWDASNGTVEDIEANDLQRITEFLKKGHGMRPGGRTALVGPDDLNFGIGRMFQAFANAEKLTVEYKTFRNMQDAMSWLNSPRDRLAS